MIYPVINEDCIFVDPKASPYDSEGVISFLCEHLVEKRYINSTYCPSVIQRERKHPTGLPTLPYAVAIPHAENKGVYKTGIAIAVLNQPVKFEAMDTPKKFLEVRLVILMAIADSNSQVPILAWIAKAMQDQNVISQLVLAKCPQEVLGILKPMMKDLD